MAAAQRANVVGHLERTAAVACPPGEPCDPPAVGAMLVFTHRGHTAARVLVGASGRFRLHLAPGRYRIRAAPAPAEGRLTPSRVRVPRHGVVRLRLTFSG